MAFRYLIYRTDFGNTIVRENQTDNSTGGTEQALFTDFVIPEIQPLYLWRVSGGTDVVPNTDQNINNWLDYSTPISPDDPIDYNTFTGYTAQTKIDIDSKVSFTIFNAYTAQTANDLAGKMNLVSGATVDNVGKFDINGQLIDSGYSIVDLTGGTGGGGIFSSDYQLSNLIDDSKPGAGLLKLNNTTPSAVTEIYIDNLNKNANDVGNVYATLDVGDTFAIRLNSDSSNIYIYNIISASTQIGGTGNSGYVKLFVSPKKINGNIPVSSLIFAIMSYGSNLNEYVSKSEFTGYTATTDTRILNIENDIAVISGNVTQNTSDIQVVSAATVQNASDIAFISGVTDTKQDILTAGSGINSTKLTNNDIIELDLNAFTVVGNMNVTITGATNAVFNDLRTIAKGLEYGGDYSANFTVRSLVDKGYVDAVAAGLDLKESVRVATTTNIDLTLGGFGGVIDGVTIQDGWRVLVKNQTNKVENGIYVYSSGSNTFARSVDFVNPNVTAGAFTFVETGTTQAASGWVLVTQDPINVGTDELEFTQFSEAGQLTPGVGIDITNGVISFDGANVAGDSISWSGTQLNIDISTGNTLGDALANKLEVSTFNAYTATTDSRISNIENDIVAISAATVQNTSDIAFISGATDTKLDTSIFTGYTASTQSNELFLIHTGGTDLNTIAATAISWDSSVVVDTAYTWTGGSVITINETGNYEVNYNIPFNQVGNNTDKSIGTNLILNNTTIIDNATSAAWTSRNNAAGAINLPTVLISLTAGDTLNLVTFRTGRGGTVNSAPNGSILIKKKDKLQ